jgi:hypothetical protein
VNTTQFDQGLIIGYETFFNLRPECGELEELKLREKGQIYGVHAGT